MFEIGGDIIKKSFDLIDLAKFVASILIFSMHCNALGDFHFGGLVSEIIARWGVPFFFISSSFFLFSKSVNGQLEKSTLLRFIKRIALLYFTWLVINLPSVVYNKLSYADLLSINGWLITLKGCLLSSIFTGSWYLLSTIFSAFLIFMLSKKFKTKTVLFITSITYIICVLTSVYHGILPSNIAKIFGFLHFPLNIFNGCFYFAVGKYIAENKERLLNIFSKAKCIILFFVFYAFYFAELFMAWRFNVFGTTDVSFSIIGVSFFLFLFCIQTPIKIKNGLLLRKLSTIIYCCQGNVLLINLLCKERIGSLFLTYLLSASIAAVICAIVILLQRKSHWKWVKYLT